MTRTSVLITAVGIFLTILGWDLYLYMDSEPGNTVTQSIIWLSSKSHLVPAFGGFLFGFLLAHFWDTK